jgi:hypothetical protein
MIIINLGWLWLVTFHASFTVVMMMMLRVAAVRVVVVHLTYFDIPSETKYFGCGMRTFRVPPAASSG